MDMPIRSPARNATARGIALLHDPLLNKGTAFTAAERDALGLRGLLPPAICSQDQQATRFLGNLRRLENPLDKYIALTALHDRNEALFFRVVMDNPDEIMPIIYTPTVGLACQNYGHILQHARGIFISASDKGRIAEVLRNWPSRDVGIIVVTDGERILGLGDLGANGMGIPVGKLSLYTACAGVAPERCLPVMFDAGTNNEDLLDDPLYIGENRGRLAQAQYDALFEEFVAAAQEVFPGVVIQFEDFATHNAFRLLAKYRDRICCFNDDIQGTAAVALAGLMSALRVTGGSLSTQTVLFLGAGEAATGIADLITLAAREEGQPEAEARKRGWLFDSRGLVVASRTDLTAHKRPYAHGHPATSSFIEAVRKLRPTAIIGVAAVGKSFTPEVLREMAAINARPIIFALSNPTSKSECTAEEAYRFTDGRALFACGSPFDPVVMNARTHVPRQGNNSYIFPGVGLGLVATKAARVTDSMFLAAARSLASLVTASDLQQGSLYPPLAGIREVSAAIAAAVARVAYDEGLAGSPRPGDVERFVRSQMYDPRYTSYV
jgi:malate dehydrogenase (oxaloacetate-decarboxylating)(NADP+)